VICHHLKRVRSTRKRQRDRAAAREIRVQRRESIIGADAVDRDDEAADLRRWIFVPGERSTDRLRGRVPVNEREHTRQQRVAKNVLKHEDTSGVSARERAKSASQSRAVLSEAGGRWGRGRSSGRSLESQKRFRVVFDVTGSSASHHSLWSARAEDQSIC